MHTSTGRFLFLRKSPSRRRAFLGVFSKPEGSEGHSKGLRRRISLRLGPRQPIAPPDIRKGHRRTPFLPDSQYARTFGCRILAKMHAAPTPTSRAAGSVRIKIQNARPKGRAPSLIQINHYPYGDTEVTQVRGQPSFPAHSAGRKNLRRTKCAAEVLSCPRTRRKGRLPSGRTAMAAYATV